MKRLSVLVCYFRCSSPLHLLMMFLHSAFWEHIMTNPFSYTHLRGIALTSVTVHLSILQLHLRQKIQTLMFSSLKLTLVLIK